MTNSSLHPSRLRPQTAKQISAACLRAARSRVTRARYIDALRVLAAVRPETLDLPPEKIERAMRIMERHLLPGSAGHNSILFVLRCRAPRSFARWIARHREILVAVRREVVP